MDRIERSFIRMEIPYFQVPNGIFDLDLPLSIYEKITYLYLCRCCNQGADAFPSYNTIAMKCGMSRRKAIYSINALIDCGLLQKEVRPRKNSIHLPNMYFLNDPSAYRAPIDSAQDAPSSAQDAPSRVHDVHQDSAHDAPKKELYKKNKIKKNHIKNTPKKGKLKFDNFTGRDYDYEALERQLLGWDNDDEE